MKTPHDLQRYFLQVKPPSSSAASDGTLLGHMLLDVVAIAKKPERASAVQTFVERTAILRASGIASLGTLLTATIGESGYSLRPQAVATNAPAALTAAEATTIGRGFEAIIRASANPSEAVDELVQTYAPLGVAAQQHDWFGPMLETIAMRRMASALFGLKLRLAIGAGFSMADMLSDINSIVTMLESGQLMGAHGMIGLIGASLAIQVLVAVLQSQHRGRWAVMREVVFVLSLTKPGVDAIRFASGAEQDAGAPLSPLVEIVVFKALEIALEAGPGAALQAYIILGGYWQSSAVVSVGISCLAIGFTTAMMAFDLDTNGFYRKHETDFYGCIPEGTRKRLLVFVELFVLHASHSLLKTCTVVMLARTNRYWIAAYMAADYGLFLLYKVVRSDVVYFVPRFGVPFSLLFRLLEKVVLDSTGFVHLRHPVFGGGFYYCFNAVMTHVACFVAAVLYSSSYSASTDPHTEGYSSANGKAGVNTTNATVANASTPFPANGTATDYGGANSETPGKISDVTLFATILTLSAVWTIAFVALLVTIKREYVATFVST